MSERAEQGKANGELGDLKIAIEGIVRASAILREKPDQQNITPEQLAGAHAALLPQLNIVAPTSGEAVTEQPVRQRVRRILGRQVSQISENNGLTHAASEVLSSGLPYPNLPKRKRLGDGISSS